MKKAAALLLGAALFLGLTGCTQSGSQEAELPNPFAEYSSLEQASQELGFGLDVPSSLGDLDQDSIRGSTSAKLLEVVYSGEEGTITLRKGQGDQDVSGDYTDYEQLQSLEADGVQYTAKGHAMRIKSIWLSGAGRATPIPCPVPPD